ncbi:MAG: hypothetical protein HC883_00725 [Bdellovibrionaceae bacterium]|nr:hypothetical protein [Pseudobdellovibrionaceae bacterium]
MKADGYNSLTIASYEGFLSALELERNSTSDPEVIAVMISKFDAALRSAPGEKVDHAAELIVSAWIDKKSGITETLPALLKWLTDEKIFSQSWVSAVKGMVVALDETL